MVGLNSIHGSCAIASAALTQHVNSGQFHIAVACRLMDIRKEIGARIKKARELQGWSLTELSRRTDNVLGASRISNYEQGTRLPKPREIKILARVLGTEPAHLMCLEGEEMTNEERQLLTSWR